MMDNFTACELKIDCEAETELILPEYNGATLRGAFFGALRRDFCLNKNLDTCVKCPAAEVCPICQLVATVDFGNERGIEIPRPFVLKPILGGKTKFENGQVFSFGITLFGNALALFPYTVLAIQRMGEIGMGNRRLAPGRFSIQRIINYNSLTGEEQQIFSRTDRVIHVPDLKTTHEHILTMCNKYNSGEILLHLITPVRLVLNGNLVKQLTFRIMMQRILRRLTDLSTSFGSIKEETGEEHGEENQRNKEELMYLLEKAEEIQLIEDTTQWVDVVSYSARRQATTPIGGLTGQVVFTGNLKPFLPFLLWGQVTHVGKDTTKGNGWYLMKNNNEAALNQLWKLQEGN